MDEIKGEIKTKCRACFSECEMHYLFEQFDQGVSLSEILKDVTTFDISEGDGLSPYLCQSCVTIVVDFFNFKRIYQENEKYVKSLLNEENQKNPVLLATTTEINVIKDGDSAIKIDHNTEEISEELEEIPSLGVSEIFADNSENIKDESKKLEITDFLNSHPILSDEEIIITCDDVEVIDVHKYSCEDCDEYFSLESDLQHHKRKKHRKSPFTRKKYITKSRKASELKITNENVGHVCKICKQQFATPSDLEGHLEIHKKFVCEHCGLGFTKRSHLNDHREVHSRDRPYLCPFCGKTFRRRTILVKHKKIHTHPRQCVCEVCGLRFNCKGTLDTHIKLKHTKIRDFHCPICDMNFPLKSTLNKHILRHDEKREQLFACSLCKMVYKDKSSLRRHVVIKHTADSKKACKFCDKQYTTNTNLLKHIRGQHTSKHLKGLD